MKTQRVDTIASGAPAVSNLVVSGAGNPSEDGTYIYDTEASGHHRWYLASYNVYIRWSTSTNQWVLTSETADPASYDYTNGDDIEYPTTAWTAADGAPPAPTVALE